MGASIHGRAYSSSLCNHAPVTRMTLTLTLQHFERLTPSSITTLASRPANGGDANHISSSAQVSADGRYVVFQSFASNLVTGDTNGDGDIFRKDLHTGEITRLSAGSTENESNGSSFNPQISADGRYVLFESYADNLVAGDDNDNRDLFRKDLFTGALTRVDTDNGAGSQGEGLFAQLSADGRYVVFHSLASDLVAGDTNGKEDIFRKNLLTGDVVRVSTDADNQQANGGNSYYAQVSADGRYVLFESDANNLVADDTNGTRDIFLKDLQTDEITRVSTDSDGIQGLGKSAKAQFSPDGRYVLFESNSSSLVAGDTNGVRDIFRKDLLTDQIIRVSTTSDGSEAMGDSFGAELSADGRYLVFTSAAGNLAAGGTEGRYDIYRKDLQTGAVMRLSPAKDGSASDGDSGIASISPDGRYVVFDSSANNLVDADGNASVDIFRVDTVMMANAAAIREGRYVELRFGTGNASSAKIAWGDGTTDTLVPTNGSASFTHTYAASGTKAALATVTEGATTWSVPYLVALAEGQAFRNTSLNDTLSGGSAADRLAGDQFNNAIYGAQGNDNVSAGLGNDIIFGGTGKDTLAGGSGKDVFVFDTKPNKRTNLDKITDFVVKDDTIYLDNAVFKKLGKGSLDKPGKLSKSFFTVGDAAKDANDYLFYNKKTGVLYYDADGSRAGQAVEIATLKKGLAMTYKDFFVI